MTGNEASDHGYYVGTMSNGDKFTVKFAGTGHSKDGKPVSGEGNWSFVDGTGKLKGLKGSGTYKGHREPRRHDDGEDRRRVPAPLAGLLAPGSSAYNRPP